MLEKWNDGMAPFGQINACGGGQKTIGFGAIFSFSTLTNHGIKCYYSIFQHSIIPSFLVGICRMLTGDSLLSTICTISDTLK
jgi:hypothetical protein